MHFRSTSEGIRSFLLGSESKVERVYSTGSVTNAIRDLSSIGASINYSILGCRNFARF